MSIIQVKNVAITLGRQEVHRNISFDINEGEVVTLLGPSGTGKTVLLKLILGLLFPQKGEVLIHGKNVAEIGEEELRELRKSIGMLFQGAALFDSLTVRENIAFPLREFGETSEGEIDKIVEEKLNLVGLPGIERKLPGELSGGQKKRVGLARALATSPEVLLFDEPTTGLDPSARGLIDNLIIELKRELKITSLVVTHDIESAKRISDRLILISNGEVVINGPAHYLWENDKDVARFASGRWNIERTA